MCEENLFDFQKLVVYQKAKAFHSACKDLLSDQNVANYTRNQLGRASLSVSLNIAEGSGKFSKADRKNYFTTARATVFECVAIVDILSDEGLISKEKKSTIFSMADELSRILFAMIRKLSN